MLFPESTLRIAFERGDRGSLISNFYYIATIYHFRSPVILFNRRLTRIDESFRSLTLGNNWRLSFPSNSQLYIRRDGVHRQIDYVAFLWLASRYTIFGLVGTYSRQSSRLAERFGRGKAWSVSGGETRFSLRYTAPRKFRSFYRSCARDLERKLLCSLSWKVCFQRKLYPLLYLRSTMY
jgi:hypothetical protein